MSTNQVVPHPGIRIRAEVIPRGMSVTKAAELIGVGRPALSNLLNGNASLSEDMALRLEKAFHKYSLNDLMAMQARYDAAQAKQKNPPSGTKPYVPPFLAIKANDIEDWVAHNIQARSRLAVFLRTLVHSTGSRLTRADFPGNDDAERPGWDGLVEASDGTPWIPAGCSGWEFGTNDDPKTKADGDFNKSVNASDRKKREETTFVFVTPRRWPGKGKWVEEKNEKQLWKEVRAYDASDLEQWLEQSLPGQAWFANEKNIPAQHVRSLDRCWDDWAKISVPPLTGTLFDSAIDDAKRNMLARLSKPSNGPIVIAADSTEEALAFLAQLLSELGGAELASYRDRVLVFDRPGVFPRLAAGALSFIPVALTREVERELAPHAKSMHTIVIYPRNAASIEFDFVIEPATYETFKKALEEMGKDRDETSRLANASGRSLTVLRRQLSTLGAVRTPEWAADPQTATKLVPFLFVGAWQSTNEADRLALSLLASDRPYDELERDIQSLAQLNDAPVWSIGSSRGIISKIDLLYAIAGFVTSADLKRYFSIARMVLGEDDPALDLDEDKRWAASIYGKTREFSSAFRKGVSETLVLLAVHGGGLFNKRLGIDPVDESLRVVRDLLPTPLTARILEANDRDLPTYAEAAPEEFLSILERDLKAEEPAVLELLRPADASIFSHPSRTGLLWALEGLSWNPLTLPRAVFILARLAQVEINDNWVNKPTHSLESIFRAWMPQTAANLQQRVDLMKELAVRFPDVAWKICVAQFGTYHQVGDYSHKPRWRPDGYGFGEPLSTREPVISFMREMVEMALTWQDHTLATLCDLVERLHDLKDVDQARVWTLIESWAKTKASDKDKADLREKIRVSTFSRRAALRAKRHAKAAKELAAAGKAAYAALEPSDLQNKHAWLFRNAWVEESAEEIEDIEQLDLQKRDERIHKMRVEAMREIHDHLGLDGLLDLAERGNASWEVGFYASRDLLSEAELEELLRLALKAVLTGKQPLHPPKSVIAGALRAIQDDNKREAILRAVAASFSEDDTAQLLVLAPFCKRTWKLVDELGKTAQTKYWSDVSPHSVHDSDAENNERVERLLRAARPRTAFFCVRFHPEKLDAQVLFQLLSAIAAGGNEKSGEYMIDHYHVEQAFKHLNASPELTLDEKAALEFAFLEVLADNRPAGYGIPNLERYVQMHPELFVQALVWTYKRRDDRTDPDEFQVPQDREDDMADRGRKLLGAIERIPGYDDLGELQTGILAKWLSAVREASIELGRGEIADYWIGEMLANAPVGEDGNWPCGPVRDVMEDIQSEVIMEGARIRVCNSRGARFRGESSGEERELAEKYRAWGQALQLSHPYVSSKLLMELNKIYEHEANQWDTEAGIRRRSVS